MIALSISMNVRLLPVNTPGNDRNLPAHIIHIILDLERVSCLAEASGKGIADDSVPDMAYMKRTVRVCTGMLQYYLFCLCRKGTISGPHRFFQHI